VLYETHSKLWMKFPPNYGVASGLFAFLMQSVIFTPPKVNSYVREALTALNYKRNCDTFGMFFAPLDDPKRPWLIEDLPEIDTTEVVRELKLTVTRPRQPRPERQNVESDDETRYPLGEAPTWNQISGSLQSDPTILIPRWEEPPEVEQYTESEPGTPESHATQIFICFTCHLWILLNPSWRTRPERRINPTTLSDALRCWSVDAILEEVIATSFRPCHSGLEGAPGRPSMSFSMRRNMYFPEDEDQGLMKAWKSLGLQPGYISKYRGARKQMEPEAQKELDNCLEELLSLCQCLPDSSRSQSGGWVWRVVGKKIVVLTNPKFFRLRRVGQKPSNPRRGQGQRAVPAHRNARSTAVAILVQEEVPQEVAEQAYRMTRNRDRRSAKSKNRRKPPPRKRGAKTDEVNERDSDGTDCSTDDEVEEDPYGDDEEEDTEEDWET